jgi:hypothetical protein
MPAIMVEGPAETIVTAMAAQQGQLTDEQLLADPTRWYPISLLSSNGNERPNLVLSPPDILLGARAPGAAAAAYNINCSGRSLEDIIDIMDMVFGTGPRPSISEFCSGTQDYQVTDEDGAGDNVGKNTSALVLKDACQTKRRSKYLVLISFDLANIDQSLYELGVNLKIEVQRGLYRGKQVGIDKAGVRRALCPEADRADVDARFLGAREGMAPQMGARQDSKIETPSDREIRPAPRQHLRLLPG